MNETKTKTTVRLLGDRVLVLPEEGEGVTTSGLIIPESAIKDTHRGTVIAVGPGPRSPFTAQVAPMMLVEGENILYAQMTGQEIEIDGVKMLVLRESDIICAFGDAAPETEDS